MWSAHLKFIGLCCLFGLQVIALDFIQKSERAETHARSIASVQNFTIQSKADADRALRKAEGILFLLQSEAQQNDPEYYERQLQGIENALVSYLIQIDDQEAALQFELQVIQLSTDISNHYQQDSRES
jgi:hypothetical protein